MADGEAMPAGDPSSALDQEPERVTFERLLRDRVAAVMSADRAPAELRGRILETLAKESGAPGIRLAGSEADRDGSAGLQRRERRLVFRRPVLLAAAAALAVTAGIIGLTQFRSPAVTLPKAQPGSLADGPVPLERVVNIIAFTEGQHDSCADLRILDRKMTARSEVDAQREAIELLNHVPKSLDCRADSIRDAGYVFAGLGRCAVPGKGRSAHLIYKPDATLAPGAPTLSLFVQEDTGDLPLVTGCRYTNEDCCPSFRKVCSCILTIWREDGLVYYLVAPATLPAKTLDAFCRAEKTRSLL